MNTLVDFVYRRTKPTQPIEGTFYWVQGEEKTEIYFAPDDVVEHLVLLNDERVDGLVDAVSTINNILSSIKEEILGEIYSKNYLTSDDLVGYAKLEDIPDPTDLSEEDYEIIANKVNEKVVPPLKWIEV